MASERARPRVWTDRRWRYYTGAAPGGRGSMTRKMTGLECCPCALTTPELQLARDDCAEFPGKF
jgi:hypothetical protein